MELPSEDVRLGIIGCGTMGKCIMSALIESGTLQSSQIQGSVNHEETAVRLKRLFPNSLFHTDNREISNWANVILICLKPQTVEEYIGQEETQRALEDKLVISIAAGFKLTQLGKWLPKSHVARAMPNTPCQIREGMVVVSIPPNFDACNKKRIHELMSPLGRCRFLSDQHMDAATALGGSGPAFACIIMEALADGGVMMGLARDVAIELAAQALQGAARMVLFSGLHPSQIKDSVTTPAGCTIAGILTMEDGKIRSVLARAIEEATKVASTLGQSTAIKK